MRVAINGLGRIGRQLLRQLHGVAGLELVAVNDVAEPAALAHLVKWDSLHGRAGFPVAWADGRLQLGDLRVPLSRIADPGQLPFGALGAEVVVDCTGSFTRRAEAARHLGSGVARVILSSPSADADLTVILGVNPERLADPGAQIVSAADPAAHALALLVTVLDAAFGVEGGLATAVESYRNDQRILDLPHADGRLGRAAALNMIPAPCAAATCLAQVLPAMAGRFDALAVRVPTPDVSLLDLSVTLGRDATAEAIRAAFLQAGAALPGLVEVLEEPLVSVDLRGATASCILDPFLTRILTPRFVKVFAWYDNEVAAAARLKDLCLALGGAR